MSLNRSHSTDKDPEIHEDLDENVWSTPKKAVGRKARMKLSGIFSNEEDEAQPSCSPEQLESALMVLIKKQMADHPHCSLLLPCIRVESTNATPCVDATAPSLDVEIPDHTLYHFPHLRQVQAQDVSFKHLNGTPEHPNSKQNEASPVEKLQQHQSKTNGGFRGQFLPLTSPLSSPRREKALPKPILKHVTSPDVPSMGSPNTWKWLDRNHRYYELDHDIDTASDTESDPDLALARSPAKINPVTAYNIPLFRDREGKDRLVLSAAMRDTSSERNPPSGGLEDFTFADMPYSLPLPRGTIQEDSLEPADSVTSITAVVDESEDLASRDGPYSALEPLLWDESEQFSVEEVKAATSTAGEIDASEEFAAFGDMPYNMPLSRDGSRQDKPEKLEPVTPVAKLNTPLSNFTSLAPLFQSPSSADASIPITSSGAITTRDSPCYAPPPSWPTLHVREEVIRDSDTGSIMHNKAWSELPFDPSVDMKHTSEPLSPPNAQKSKASSRTCPKSSLSALPYRLKSTSPCGLTNPCVALASFEDHDKSKDMSFQDGGASTRKTRKHTEIKYECSHSSESPATSTMPPSGDEKPDLQSAISSPERPLAEPDRAFNELPTSSEGLSKTLDHPRGYLPAVFKVKHIIIPERETLNQKSGNATKVDTPPLDSGVDKAVPKIAKAFKPGEQAGDPAEENWRYWMDDSIDHSKDGFPAVDQKSVPFERSPAMIDSFMFRHYENDAIPAWKEENGVTAWDGEVKKRVAEHLLKVVYDLEALAGQEALTGKAAQAA